MSSAAATTHTRFFLATKFNRRGVGKGGGGRTAVAVTTWTLELCESRGPGQSSHGPAGELRGLVQHVELRQGVC